MLGEDESPLSEPFWLLDSVTEGQVIETLLRRRFPRTYDVLSRSLEDSDPLDIVYEGNPHEYSDVVAEILVLLSAPGARLERLSAAEIEQVVREGLARRFGELPDDDRVGQAVRLILERAAETGEF